MVASKTIDLSPIRSLYPFRSHYQMIDGWAYHYIDEGGGEPLIMVHGNPTWSFYYRHLIHHLAPAYRTIAPDHIGCGLSAKPSPDRYAFRLQNRVDNLAALIAHLQLESKITLIGHDWGGMIAMAYALRAPETIGRIVLMNTAAFLPPHAKRLPLRLRLMRNLPFFAYPAVRGLNLFVVAALWMASAQKLPPLVQKGLKCPYNCWHNRAAVYYFVKDIPLTPDHPSYGLVHAVDSQLHRLRHIPLLICWGEKDFVFDTDYRDEWRRRFPAARLHSFPDAGHYVLEDKPDEILAAITDFLQKFPL